MENPQHIIVASRRLRRICTGLIILLPLTCALFWVFFNRIRGSTSMIPLPVPVTEDLPGLIRFFAFLAELLPMTALIYGLRKLRKLFRYYEKGLIFTEKNVACFRSLGRTLIAWVVCDVVKNSLLSIVLTLHNPPGQRLITVGLYSADFTAVFVGIVILIIAWVMDEARKIQEDQALII
jgi:uncharacterized membrane protein YvlD (DUF360 family)